MFRTIYRRWVLPNRALDQRLRPFAIFAQFVLQHLAELPRQLLTVDLVRFLVCLPRYVVFFHILRRRKFAADLESGVSRNTLEHNMRGTGELAAPRSHTLIRPIVTIGSVQANIRNLKVLTIGPRVEGEIYNLVGYGFRRKNITGLDLFSYSPYIEVGNMHHMQFADDQFDVVLSGWVLGYSDDMPQCAREMMRVCKPGGVIAVANAYSPRSDEEIEAGLGYQIGSKVRLSDLPMVENLFGVTPEDCYFRDDGSRDGYEGAPMITIFRNRPAAKTIGQ